MQTIKLFVFTLFLATGFTFQVCAQDDSTIESDSLNIFEYLYNLPYTPHLIIDTDVKSLIKNKMKEEKSVGKLTINDDKGESMQFDIKVRPRGNMRKRQCYFPPLKADLKKEQLSSYGFSDLDKLKFVLQCRDQGVAKDYLMKERLIYDLYAVVDTINVRTKLITIDLYQDGEIDKSLEGFVIEEEHQFAKRIGGRVIEKGNVRTGSLERMHYLHMGFFQYMIANTDWSIPNKHNVEIVGLPQYERLIAIPYDFDYAGFVGTNYAVPHESLPIEDVRDYHFMPKQVTEEEAAECAKYFLERESQFYDAINKADYCSDGVKKDSEKFISKFFDLLRSEKRVSRAFVNN